MKKALTQSDLVALMKKRQGARSVRAFALELGLSNTMIGAIYENKTEIGDKVAGRLGFERRVLYIPKSAESEKQA
jgi:hypothetical protein